MWGVSYALKYCHGLAAELSTPLSESEWESQEMMLYCIWVEVDCVLLEYGLAS